MNKPNLFFIMALGSLILLAASCVTPAAVQQPEQPAVQPPAPEQTYQPPTYSVKGTVFHDYNGNGIRENSEPAIPGIEIDLCSGDISIKSVNTDLNGAYSIQLDEKGSYSLYVNKSNVLGPNDQPYRYISISKEEFKKIADSLEIAVDGNTEKDIAVMQGFLTLPFGPDAKLSEYDWLDNEFGILFYVDWKAGEDSMTWHGKHNTFDGQDQTHFFIEENTPILAAAPGKVIYTFLHPVDPYDFNQKCTIRIVHQPSPSEKYYFATSYYLLNKMLVKKGDVVKRGDVIGLSGKVRPSGQSSEDARGILPFQVDLSGSLSPPYVYFLCDAYRPIMPDSDFKKIRNAYMQAASLHGFTEKDFQELMTVGYWTKDNDPQYPDISGP